MFANPTKVGISQRVVATLVASALLAWSLGAHLTAQAADLAEISNTLSDSAPGATPSHTISFLAANDIGVGEAITVTFDTQDDGAGGQDFAGGAIDTAVAPANVSYQIGGSGGFTALTTFTAEDGDSFSFNGLSVTAGQQVEIVVADGIISNPSTVDSYEIAVTVANTENDSGRTRVAIVDTVEVTAIVETVFDFTITGVGTTTSTNGTSTTGSTSPTAINFGTLVAGGVYNLAQTLNVTTNARNGFVVTVESDSNLESSNGAVIDDFQDGSDVSDPEGNTWASPAQIVTDETTWGHWGVRTDDSDLFSLGGFAGYTDDFAAEEFIAVSSTTPREVFHHDGPSDGTSADIGEVDVLYRVEITPLQEAAQDYNTTLTYIATPTF